ncbi:putative glycine dehydrogenase (decarboxylating), mitochondrial [Aspergillus lentulus]|uniref:Glycine cleavage system P protein n=1 Tax=Aspergillus lentulus TaxID=293939 RepID=A0ABQ0ZYT5_ASPLE|nr:putative glycine dehydrogenase (decarboxylating), mitochondrial [Aspergillus lentulus]GFF36219.1 putative glycine dehydrogenase (decarboxylating), mitochondrial [Aspergillus lentulus]GFF69448.1 putative glycine dehydrogenase (decarboxylating), mitochondrial [Aspergillus lentulus]GFG05127.1 putative glycine dehydrogenase (decarboxylating), mitochondrial [Aspergillus lentulus]
MAASWCALRGTRQLALRTRLRASPASISLRKASPSPVLATRRYLNTTTQATPASRRAVYTSSVADHGDPHPRDLFQPLDTFPRRHIGPSPEAAQEMLSALDPPVASLDEFVKQVLPADILSKKDLAVTPPSAAINLPRSSVHGGLGETDMLKLLETYRKQIDISGKTYLGTGYYPTIVPPVILRNILENPAWYTSYTPYQPEISQGRLESLLNFQTLTADLTGLPFANASVLDEATAAAEAMTMSLATLPMAKQKKPGKAYVVSDLCHPQTIAVMRSRAEGFGINLVVGDIMANDFELVKKQGDNLIGVLAQYPDTEGGVYDFQALSDSIHAAGGTFSVATDLLALTLLKAPGEFGADIAFGNAQRFGVPMGFGGPHAAFFACADKYKRKVPGRVVGVSKDRLGNRALRLALQTREQHIRREKATSNICTAQALLANMSAMYAVYHGPVGLKSIAQRVMAMTSTLQEKLTALGYNVPVKGGAVFDTLSVEFASSQEADALIAAAREQNIFLRRVSSTKVGISLDETVGREEVKSLLQVFSKHAGKGEVELAEEIGIKSIPPNLERTSAYLTHPVFNTHHSETEMLRYIRHLESKDLSLAHSMIPLGSCTMKLNATTEMIPVSWPEFSQMHPFMPADRAKGYTQMIDDLEQQLAEITGMAEITVQPNSGAQGEFAGLRVIKKYLEAKGDEKRNICLIPVSAHGTNPASAAMAGMRVVSIKCDTKTGNLDLADLKAKCEKHKDELAAIMITYPSTFGVYEPGVKEACEIVHQHGGQVYMDGANMNAQIGLCSPGEIGADVCHLNLHKTFCIPHGGGGPGVGPIGVAEHLRPFLPSHPASEYLQSKRGETSSPPISAAPWGSASILPITFNYINMMGAKGLTHATKITLLNANYILSRLKPHYPILYTNDNGRCAHEFILDVRKFKDTCGIEAIDIAKRLQDYGFHAPTMSWPVANTLMIEPTESENKAELDRFCDALISIRKEIAAVESGEQPREGNVLKNSPHTQRDLLSSEWNRPYSREAAAYPLPYLVEKKFWPSVTRVDDAYGDQNLFCTCGPVDETD